MAASSVGMKDVIKKTLENACNTNAYPIGRAIEAGVLMFTEATPEEQAKKMRVVDAIYK